MTSVLFQGGEKLISSGAMDGQIKIWDLRKTYTNLKQDPLAFHVFPYPGQGIRKHSPQMTVPSFQASVAKMRRCSLSKST